MGPPILHVMPRWLLESLTKVMMANEDRKATVDDVTMSALAPTLHYDFQLVIETYAALERYRAIAQGLFGEARVPSAAHWKTHDLRARTIRLVRAGLDLMRGGYIRLLSGRHRRR